MRDMVLVLNFDEEASRAVTRKLRSERVLCKVVPGDISLEDVQAREPLGLLLAGGAEGKIPSGLDRRIPQSGMPLLALGDAAHLLLNQLSGTVGDIALQNAVAPVHFAESPLTENVEDGERLFPCARELHLPEHVKPLCFAQETAVGFCHDSLPLYALQMQVEQNDPDSSMILRNFTLNICGCTTWWDDDAFVTRAVEEIRRIVGDGRAVCAFPGGLASGVSALLAFKALGPRLTCLFVDSGLTRDHEIEDGIAFCRDTLGMEIVHVDAQARFLDALKGIKDAPEKRRVIGETLNRVLLEEMNKLGPVKAFIRSTTYNDAKDREEASAFASDETAVIEPMGDLFVEEVSRIADFLGLPGESVTRQPFPFGGLAMRVLGEATRERLQTLRAADAAFRSELQHSPAVKRLWQYFAVLWPLPGDETQSVICLRAAQASERSYTFAPRLPYDAMENVTETILRDQKNVCRVVYDLTPTSTCAGIEWQ